MIIASVPMTAFAADAVTITKVDLTATKNLIEGYNCHIEYDGEKDETFNYYHLDDITYMNVRKEYDIYDELWTVTVEYIRHKPAGRKKVPRKRTIAEDRQRILQDVDAQIDD